MNGVMMPSVSAGSSQRDASVMWTPHVIVPSGAAVTGDAGRITSAVTRSSPSMRERKVMITSGGAVSIPLGSAFDGPGRQTLHHVLLEQQHEHDGGQRAQ